MQSVADQIVISQLGDNLRDSWLSVSGLSVFGKPCAEMAGDCAGEQWRFEKYTNSADRLQVAFVDLPKVAHGWPEGLQCAFSIPSAPNVSELAWAFFRQTQHDRKASLTGSQWQYLPGVESLQVTTLMPCAGCKTSALKVT
ncbi:MAG: hypothetical protein AB8B63_11000 [Granulosicoccus sp.]